MRSLIFPKDDPLKLKAYFQRRPLKWSLASGSAPYLVLLGSHVYQPIHNSTKYFYFSM